MIDNIYIPEYKLKRCLTYGTIIFDNDFDISLLKQHIIKVIKTLSPVPYSCRGIIPITNRISHWLLTLILNNNKIVVVNTSSRVYITVHNGRINDKYNIVNYNNYFGIIKHIYGIDNKITLSTFLNKYLTYFKDRYKCYSLFGCHNCQHIVSECLKHIFDIDDKESKCENYNMGILMEIYKNNKYATNFKNINCFHDELY